MTILDREFTKIWLRSTFLCLAIFVLLFLTGDLFGLTEDLLESTPSLSVFFNYLVFRAGFGIFFLSPLIALLGSYWSVIHWKRHNEWTAGLSSGSSPVNLLRGPLIMLVSFLLILTGFSIVLLPETADRMHSIRDYIFKGKTPPEPVYQNLHLTLNDKESLRIGRFTPGSAVLSDITITRGTGQRIQQRRRSHKARYQQNQRWELTDVTVRTFHPNGTVDVDTHARETIKLESPKTLQIVFQNNPRVGSTPPERLSLSNLMTMIEFRKIHGLNHSIETVYYHWKFAYPLSTALLGLAGFVLAIRFDVKPTTGIGACLLFGFLYWVGFNLLLALGQSSTYLGGTLEHLFILASTYGAHMITGLLLVALIKIK